MDLFFFSIFMEKNVTFTISPLVFCALDMPLGYD